MGPIWFCVLVFLTTAQCRYIDTEASMTSTDDDDFDLEEALTQYYEDLVEEYYTLKKELDMERSRLSEEKEVEGLLREVLEDKLDLEERKLDDQIRKKEKFLAADDYDYMSDAPAPDAQDSAKSADGGQTDGVKISWPTLNNGTMEDAKLQRESGTGADSAMGNKELRLKTIKDIILDFRRGGYEGNTTVPPAKVWRDVFEIHKDLLANATSNVYIQKVQSFYPACELPKSIDEVAWAETTSMNLLFNVTYPKPAPGNAISVLNATLRLFKVSQPNSTETEEATGPGDRQKPDKSLLTQYGVLPPAAAVEDERRLRVSVYWYTKVLRRNKERRRKLMDSRMFSSTGDEWIEFNIQSAVRSWKQSGRNFGLSVTVEDDEGVLLNAEKFIHTMNCSIDTAHVKPLPFILIAATKQYMKDHPSANQSDFDSANGTQVNPFPYSTYPFPILDVSTVEVPVQETDTYQQNLQPATSRTLIHRNNSTNLQVPQTNQGSNSVQFSFSTVPLGSPSSAAGQNRNNLTPILTKSDVVTMPEDVRMQKELLQVQAESPRRRHSRKHASSD